MQDSAHFQQMLKERNIQKEWAAAALDHPDRVEEQDDGTRHYLKQVPEYGNRWLRVVVNPRKEPPVRITAFFDRRLRRAEQ